MTKEVHETSPSRLSRLELCAFTRGQDDEECEWVLTLNKPQQCQISLISQEIPHGSCLSASLFNRQFSYWACSFALCPLPCQHFQHPLLPYEKTPLLPFALTLDSFPACSLTQERSQSTNDRR